MMLLCLNRAFSCGLGVLWLLTGVFAHAPAFAAAQDIVVMVEARHTRGSGTAFGAGLVVGRTPERTVIVTALHVVANEAGDLAPEITVEFSTRRGRFYGASASPQYADRALDLAVLLVEHDRAGIPPDVLEGSARVALSPTPTAQLAGANVSLIGAMNRQRWARGPQADMVVVATAQQLRVRSGEAAAGASGGGIFDSFGRLLGMASRIDSASGELLVLPMDEVIARLRRWGMPTTLESTKAASTDDGLLAQLREGLRFNVTYTEPKPTVPGGQWPVARGSGAGFLHRLEAVLSPTLKELDPLVRLTFPDHPHLTDYNHTAYDLKAPSYTLEGARYPIVLIAHAVLVLPDRRQIGPVAVRLDFATGPENAARQLGGDAPEAVVRSRNQFEFEKRESEAAKQRGDEAAKAIAGTHAINVESGMRSSYYQTFPHWRIRCEKREERWECSRSSQVPRHPYGGNLGNVVHSLKIGASERDLSVTFPQLISSQCFPSRRPCCLKMVQRSYSYGCAYQLVKRSVHSACVK
jgi:hypothetical protein